MKKKFKSFPSAMLIASVLLTVISVAARILLTLTAVETEHGVYEFDNVFPTIYHAALLIVLIAVTVIAVLKAPSGSEDYIFPSSTFSVFTSCVCAFLLIFEAFLTVYYNLTSSIVLTKFDILEICFAVPSAIYFLGILRSGKKQSVPLMLTSFAPIAWCAVCLIRIYFDTTILQVSPNKIFGEIALLAAMIYLLSESRVQLGKFSHKLFLATASAAPILLMTSAIPNLLYSAQLSVGASDNFMRYAIDAALALFIWARLCTYRASPEGIEIPASENIE